MKIEVNILIFYIQGFSVMFVSSVRLLFTNHFVRASTTVVSELDASPNHG